eukprot:TRINITY_DN29382_c0_g1_i1.p1 TRINITY_DN29382_c0_g1~~TRINITY_DN29382_c0_g1_i1.p1  ORF type:complete len:591 (-),score=105.69 TRINITY_DN29382_c0_g1_i1:159-1931(-)
MESHVLEDIRSWERSIALLLDQQEQSNKVLAALMDSLSFKSSSLENMYSSDKLSVDVKQAAIFTKTRAELKNVKSRCSLDVDEVAISMETRAKLNNDECRPSLDEICSSQSPSQSAGRAEGSASPEATPRRSQTSRRSVMLKELQKSRSTLDFPSVGRDGEGLWTCIKAACKWLLQGLWFDYTICFVIAVNSICIAVETQWSIDHEIDALWPQSLDMGFMCVYVIEIAVRLIALGRKNFEDGWFWFDIALVIAGLLSNLVMPIMLALLGDDVDAEMFQKVLVIRSFRLLRLVRAVRLTKTFRTAWRLVHGLVTSGNTMVSTLGILAISLFIFSCLGVEIITKDPELAMHEDTALIIAENFNSLFTTFLTFLQFMSMDSCASIYAPLVKRRWYLLIYFVALILLVSVTLMNLVTAVLVEGAFENAQQDKEMNKHLKKEKIKVAIPKLERLFAEMDTDNDGMLTLEEVDHVPVDVIPQEFFENSTVSCMQEVFKILDVDGHGEGTVSKEEFIGGLLQIILTDVPVETVHMLQMLKALEHSLQDMRQDVQDIRKNTSRDMHDAIRKNTSQDMHDAIRRTPPKPEPENWPHISI